MTVYGVTVRAYVRACMYLCMCVVTFLLPSPSLLAPLWLYVAAQAFGGDAFGVSDNASELRVCV